MAEHLMSDKINTSYSIQSNYTIQRGIQLSYTRRYHVMSGRYNYKQDGN
jgi:hypothetical protein